MLLARVRQGPVLTCGSCDLPLLQQSAKAALEERAQGCKRKGRVDFALFNIPGIAKSLMPVDNERKHGGVAEPIRRCMAGY
jgi:hypothetical protein